MVHEGLEDVLPYMLNPEKLATEREEEEIAAKKGK